MIKLFVKHDNNYLESYFSISQSVIANGLEFPKTIKVKITELPYEYIKICADFITAYRNTNIGADWTIFSVTLSRIIEEDTPKVLMVFAAVHDEYKTLCIQPDIIKTTNKDIVDLFSYLHTF